MKKNHCSLAIAKIINTTINPSRVSVIAVSFRLIGTIFSIFAREKLGYDISMVSADTGATIDTDLDTTFRKLSSCRNEL